MPATGGRGVDRVVVARDNREGVMGSLDTHAARRPSEACQRPDLGTAEGRGLSEGGSCRIVGQDCEALLARNPRARRGSFSESDRDDTSDSSTAATWLVTSIGEDTALKHLLGRVLQGDRVVEVWTALREASMTG